MERNSSARNSQRVHHPRWLHASLAKRCIDVIHSAFLWRLPTPEDAIAFAQWEADPIGAWCSRCGAANASATRSADGACADCRGRRFAYESVTRLGSYRDPLDAWIKLIKSSAWKAMAHTLGSQLAARAPPIDLIVPIPMHLLRREMRGIDHTGEIADAMSRALHVPVCRALSQSLARQQMGTSRTKRLRNTNRFRANRRTALVRDLRVGLVDDVRTTGSTLQSAASLLRDAGAARVDAIVIAARDSLEFEEVQHRSPRLLSDASP